MARRPTVSIVGCGCAGGAIGLALSRNGYSVTAAWSHSRAGRQRAQRLLGVPVLSDPAAVAAAADFAIVAVPDDAILEMGAELAKGELTGRVVAHTSGGVSIKALDAVQAAGARPASVHPLQTLPDANRGADALNGAAVAITSDPRDRAMLFRLARAWGGKPFPVPDDGKMLYHAAAVFASNYVVSSVWAALRLLERLGIPNARQLLGPLTQTSVTNVTSMPPDRAITGPIVRGDAHIVREHLQALAHADPTGGRITDAYRSMARLTAALARVDMKAFDKATA